MNAHSRASHAGQSLFDVIVVGGGGSGLAAAVSAAEHGLSVLLLEKQSQLGGTTGIAVGSFTANRTRYQACAGIVDDAAQHAEDVARIAPPELESRSNTELRHYFLEHAAETLDWLTAMGLRFHGPSPEPPNRVARMHNVVPNAKAYIATLQARLLRIGGTVRCEACVTSLLRSGRCVEGVEANVEGRSCKFKARLGVVLAAGDYASNPQMIADHKGIQFREVEGINPTATGDGHLLASAAGAPLLNMDVTYGPELRFIPPPGQPFAQLVPATGPLARLAGWLMPIMPRSVINMMIKRLLVTWQHPEHSLFDEGAVLLNQHGERFCNEDATPGREIAVSHQPGKSCFILLDERLIEKFSNWPHFISTAPQIAYAYVDDYLRLRPDIALHGDDLRSVAQQRNLPPEAVEATVKAFNQFATAEQPDPFGRSRQRESHQGSIQPLRGNRWVLLGPAKAYFTVTAGSPAISKYFEVLDELGEPIPGLYAVGQNGLGGQILWGHGLHIAWALTSGRLVGQVLAAKKQGGAAR